MNDPSTPTNEEDLFFQIGGHEPEGVDIDDPSSDLFEVVACDHLEAIVIAATPNAVDGHSHVRRRRLSLRALIHGSSRLLLNAGARLIRHPPRSLLNAGARLIRRPPRLLIDVGALLIVVAVAISAWRYWSSPRAASVQPQMGVVETGAVPAPGAVAAPAQLVSSVTPAPPVPKPVAPAPIVATKAPSRRQPLSVSRGRANSQPRPVSASPVVAKRAVPVAPIRSAKAPRAVVLTTPSIAERWARVTSASDAALALSRLSTQSAAGPKVSDEQAVRFAIDRYLRSRTGEQVDFTACTIQVAGDVASAGCTGKVRSAGGVSQTPAALQAWSFALSRAGRDWQVDKAESR